MDASRRCMHVKMESEISMKSSTDLVFQAPIKGCTFLAFPGPNPTIRASDYMSIRKGWDRSELEPLHQAAAGPSSE